jgi:hypothetical protein
MGEYRENSELWRPTATNLKGRSSRDNERPNMKWKIRTVKSYSHEYIGKDNKSYDTKWMEINEKQGVLF